MRAITIEPGKADSVRLQEIDEPDAAPGTLLVRTVAVGVCGTDQELIAGKYGWAPPGRERLVLGHESLGRVEEALPASGFAPGDLVVGIVRRPDPVPCPNCAVGEWDMCRNGRYTEHGIKELDGFCRERFRLQPESAVRVDASLGLCGVLLEPTSVVAKAWEQIERIATRSHSALARVLVTGAGPIGLIAALLAAQRGYEVHVLDRVEDGPKPALVRSLGATYHCRGVREIGFVPDVVVECTGVAAVVFDAMQRTAPDGIVCLTGVSSGGHIMQIDIGLLNRSLVLENLVVFGSVNANRRHYETAAQALARADRGWLARLITRRVRLDRWHEAYERRADDVKTVLDFGVL